MLLAYHPELITTLREPTVIDPWRVLISGCLAGWACGVDGTDNGVGTTLMDLLRLPTFRSFPFCPEEHTLGTPRSMPDIHGGDGFDVLSGKARILDEHGEDLTTQMIEGAQAMLAFARESDVELAILTDMSAACGTQVISDGCRLVQSRSYQKGVGVGAAVLLRDGIHVVSQRDYLTLAKLRARLESGYEPPEDALDHHEHPWTVANLPKQHPRS